MTLQLLTFPSSVLKTCKGKRSVKFPGLLIQWYNQSHWLLQRFSHQHWYSRSALLSNPRKTFTILPVSGQKDPPVAKATSGNNACCFHQVSQVEGTPHFLHCLFFISSGISRDPGRLCLPCIQKRLGLSIPPSEQKASHYLSPLTSLPKQLIHGSNLGSGHWLLTRLNAVTSKCQGTWGQRSLHRAMDWMFQSIYTLECGDSIIAKSLN